MTRRWRRFGEYSDITGTPKVGGKTTVTMYGSEWSAWTRTELYLRRCDLSDAACKRAVEKWLARRSTKGRRP